MLANKGCVECACTVNTKANGLVSVRFQMYGRYTQELGVYAKEEAARLRESGQRRSVSERSRTLDLLEYDKGRCAKCRSKFHTARSTERLMDKQQPFKHIHLKWKLSANKTMIRLLTFSTDGVTQTILLIG